MPISCPPLPLLRAHLLACLAVLMLAGLAPLRAQAAFISVPGVDAVYDDVLDITWSTIVTFESSWADADARASGFVLEVGGIVYDEWRLPTIDVDGVGDKQLYSSFGCASNPTGCVDNELAYLVHFNDLTVFSGLVANGVIFSSDTLVNAQGPSVWIQNTIAPLFLGTVTQASSGNTFVVHDGNILPEPSVAMLLGLTASVGGALRRGPRRSPLSSRSGPVA